MKKFHFGYALSIFSILLSSIVMVAVMCAPPDPPIVNLDIHTINVLNKPLTIDTTAGGFLRFALDTIPATPGYDATPGMKSTFYVYTGAEGVEVMFGAIVYNSSYTEIFHINPYDSTGAIDTNRIRNGDAKNIFRAELLEKNGRVLRTAEKTDFSISQTQPVRPDAPFIDLPLTIGPGWADEYSRTTPGQDWNLETVRPGKYRVRFTFDPANLYGQRVVASWDVQWTGTEFYSLR